MKIICDCGNEVNLIEPDDEEDRNNSGEGIYVIPNDYSKFDFWSAHDQLGFVCRKCKKAVWMFT